MCVACNLLFVCDMTDVVWHLVRIVICVWPTDTLDYRLHHVMASLLSHNTILRPAVMGVTLNAKLKTLNNAGSLSCATWTCLFTREVSLQNELLSWMASLVAPPHFSHSKGSGTLYRSFSQRLLYFFYFCFYFFHIALSLTLKDTVHWQ